MLGTSNLANILVNGNLDVLGTSNLANVLTNGNLDVLGMSNLANVLVNGNLDVLGMSNLANVIVNGNLDVLGISNLANVGIAGNLNVLGMSNLGNVDIGNLVVNGIAGVYGDSGIGGNLDVIGYISGANLLSSGISNLTEVGISANLDVLGMTTMANLSAGNLVVLELSNLANVGVSGNLDVLGISNLGNVDIGNLSVYGLTILYGELGVVGNLGILGSIAGNNTEFGNLVIREEGKIEFRDTTTYIQSGIAGNLDIWATDGNVNITANHDIVLTANAPSTIRLVGPGNAPIASFNVDAGGNAFMSFGGTSGEAGYGIKADASGNVLIKSSGADWGSIGNTQISIAGRTVALGGSNTIGFENLDGTINADTQITMGTIQNDKLANSGITIAGQPVSLGGTASIGFSDLTGNIAATQIDPSSITNDQLSGFISNDKLTNSGITIAGQNVSLGGTANIGFSDLTGNIAATQIDPSSITNDQLAGFISNDKLINSSLTIAGQNVSLGGTASIGFSDLTGNISATQIDPASITNDQLAGSITNAKLSNSNIVIGGQTINLGGSGSLAFSNITGNISATQIDPNSITNTQLAGSITNAKLSNSNIVIGGQTINLGGSGSLAFSDLTGNIAASQISPLTITNAQLAGSITNSKLVNSNIVIGGQTINLGGSGNIGMSNLSDVSNSDILDGSLLRWDSTALLYYRRRTQYYSYAAYGQLASYSSATQKAILLSSTWSSRTEDTIYFYPAAKFTINGTTGSIGGFDSNKVYKIEFHISQNSNNISTTMSWRARIFGGTTSAGTKVRDVSIGSVTDDRAPSLHCVVIIGGYTSYYFDYGITAGTYSTTVSPDCQISISFNEI